MLCQQIMTSLSFFQFVTNLEQSRNRIREAWSIILSCSLMKTFYLTTEANKDKKFFRGNPHCIALEKDGIFTSKRFFRGKNC